jgi:hypothetical protein
MLRSCVASVPVVPEYHFQNSKGAELSSTISFKLRLAYKNLTKCKCTPGSYVHGGHDVLDISLDRQHYLTIQAPHRPENLENIRSVSGTWEQLCRYHPMIRCSISDDRDMTRVVHNQVQDCGEGKYILPVHHIARSVLLSSSRFAL